MKRSLFRVGAALATLALAGTLASCSAGSSSSTSKTGTSTSTSASEGAAPGEDAGFEEQPLGDDVHVGPLVVGGVYFQPVDMEPEMGTPAAESSMHIEADVSAAADNKLGYGAGDFVPGLTVDYAIKDKSGTAVQEGTLMPMNAVTFTIKPPSGWLLHTDKTTGVEGRFWTEPLVAEFPDWQWDPTAVSW